MLHPQCLSHLVQVIRAMVQLQERFMMFYASNRMAVPPGNIPITRNRIHAGMTQQKS